MKNKKKSKYNRIFIKIYPYFEFLYIIFFVIAAILGGLFLGDLLYSIDTGKDIKVLAENEELSLPTEIYDDKEEKISEFYIRKRKIVSLKDVNSNLLLTLLTTEDSRFYKHSGIDTYRILGAFFVNLMAMDIKEGGSTLTQQLAKQTLFPPEERLQRKFKRKLLEFWYVLQIEKKFSKQEILEKYLNKIELSAGADGFAVASDYYFGKNIGYLSIAEAAALSTIPSSHKENDPHKNRKNVENKQKIILDKLVASNYITNNEADQAIRQYKKDINRQLILKEGTKVQDERPDKAPYFTEYVRQELVKIFKKDYDKLYAGGYKVYTTLNLDAQQKAGDILREHLDKQDIIFKKDKEYLYKYAKQNYAELLDVLGYSFDIDSIDLNETGRTQEIKKKFNDEFEDELGIIGDTFGLKNITNIISNKNENNYNLDYNCQGAIIALEPKTGYIKTMIGGREYLPKRDELNRCIHKPGRQTGSAFKAFVYATALASKQFSPASVEIDEMFSPGNVSSSGKPWIVHNYSHKYRGSVTLRTALKESINTISVKIVQKLKRWGNENIDNEIGIEPVINMTQKLTDLKRDRFPPVGDLSISLGAMEMTPMELCKGYAVFANEGKEVNPVAILRIEDRYGRVIWKYTPPKEKKQLIPKGVNYIIVDMLKSVIEPGGTGNRAYRMAELDIPCAGKTGTTSNYKDAWFSGFTTDLVTTVWVGFDKAGRSLGSGQAGGVVAAPIWAEYMKYTQNNQNKWYEKPDDVFLGTVCKETGWRAGEGCYHERITDLFVKGAYPEEICNGINNYLLKYKEAQKIDKMMEKFTKENLPKEFVEMLENASKNPNPDGTSTGTNPNPDEKVPTNPNATSTGTNPNPDEKVPTNPNATSTGTNTNSSNPDNNKTEPTNKTDSDNNKTDKKPTKPTLDDILKNLDNKITKP